MNGSDRGSVGNDEEDRGEVIHLQLMDLNNRLLAGQPLTFQGRKVVLGLIGAAVKTGRTALLLDMMERHYPGLPRRLGIKWPAKVG